MLGCLAAVAETRASCTRQHNIVLLCFYQHLAISNGISVCTIGHTADMSLAIRLSAALADCSSRQPAEPRPPCYTMDLSAAATSPSPPILASHAPAADALDDPRHQVHLLAGNALYRLRPNVDRRRARHYICSFLSVGPRRLRVQGPLMVARRA